VIRNGKAIDHSNQGGFGGSAIAWLVTYAIFLAAVYAMGFWDFTHVWIPGLIALALAFLAMFIPQQLLGRGDTVDAVAIHAARPAEIHAPRGTGALHH